MEKKRLLYGRLMAGFLIVMAVLTFLSRILDSMTVPKVITAYSKTGNVKYVIDGEGTFLSETGSYITTEPDLKINQVDKKPGQRVELGESVFSYQMEGIIKKHEDLRTEIEKVELELKQMDVEARGIPLLSDETLALQALDSANRALESGTREMEDTKVSSQEKMEELKKNYHRNMDLTEEEMEEETRRLYQSAKLAYESAKNKRTNAVNRGERALKEAEKKLTRLIENQADEEEIEAAREAVSAAEDDLNEVKEEQDLLVDEARENYDNAEEDYGDTGTESRSAAEALKNNYESAVEAQEEKIKNSEKQVETLQEAVHQAELAVANARITDAGSAAGRQKSTETAALQRQAKELDYKALVKELEELDQLAADEGQIKASASGIIAEIGITPGAVCTGGEVIRLGNETLKFEGTIEKKQGELIKPGSKLVIAYGEQNQKWDAAVDSVDYLTEEDNAKITASVEAGVGKMGATAGFTISLESQQYSQVIPIEALRQDNAGYYILLVGTKKTVLGEELEAVKLNVDVLEKSSTEAAVSGAFTTEDQMIVSSSKTIFEGDRIRMAESN
jgi:hypothetical protein